MNDKEQEALSLAYAEVMNTHAGRLVMANLIEKFSVTVPVYAFGTHNELSDISYRDGQRNCGIYVYNQIALASPDMAARLYSEILIKENTRIQQEKLKRLRIAERGDDE